LNRAKKLSFVLCFILVLSFAYADEAARPVVIRVYSIPGGASFWIDGENTNLTTPCMINLAFNYDNSSEIIPKKYRLLKDGYKPHDGLIRGPQDSTINVALQRLLIVFSDASCLQVLVRMAPANPF
jgi:hypothetical protein